MLKLLWPALRWGDDYAFEREAVGDQAEAVRLKPDPRPRPVAAAPAAPRQPSGAQIAVIMGNQEATVQVPKSE